MFQTYNDSFARTGNTWPARHEVMRPRVQIATGTYRDGVPVVLVEGGHAVITRHGSAGFYITIYFDEGYIYDWGSAELRFSRPSGFVFNVSPAMSRNLRF